MKNQQPHYTIVRKEVELLKVYWHEGCDYPIVFVPVGTKEMKIGDAADGYYVNCPVCRTKRIVRHWMVKQAEEL